LSEKPRKYDIIIPVYGGLHYLRQCVNSILKNTRHPYNLVIVDDGNNPIIKEYLRTIKSAGMITNRKNLGWLKSCNIGIENTENDVVLLNSDTMVTEGWLEKMDRCAYSDSKIGIVNPLSNNGTFLSIPRPSIFNPIPAGFTLESFASLVSELSECRYPSIPTVLGFCLLIKRELSDCIGLLDEKFELSYGGSNDFYLKAKRKGYRAVCADDAFVYHYGKKSFGDSPDREVHHTRAIENENNSLSYLRVKLLTKISKISPEYKDKVSMIMPVYNREIYLEEAISSVLNQSYSNFELIIVDDGSTDNSLSIAREFAKNDRRVTVVALEENQGFAIARNEGLKRAKGEFITQFDSDDVMLPNAIKSRVEFLRSNLDIDLVFGKIHLFIDKDGKQIESKYSKYIRDVEDFYEIVKNHDFYEKIRKSELGICGADVTSMFRRDVLFREGFYEESIDLGADSEFFARILKGTSISFLNEPLLLHRLHDTNISKRIDNSTGEWIVWSQKPEYGLRFQYLQEITRLGGSGSYGNRIDKEINKKIKVFIDKGENSMRKSRKAYSMENYPQFALLIGQVGHMAELIDRLRLQIKEQQIAIVAKDQHINNLNKAIVAKDQHINNLNKAINEAIVAKDQHINNLNKAIVAKDQHIASKDERINNLNKAIVAKDQHIANLDRFIRDLTGEIVKIKKYSVFYNLLSRFRKELLMWLGKSRK